MNYVNKLFVILLFFPLLATAGQLERVGLEGIQAEVCDIDGAQTTFGTWDSRSLIIISGNPNMVSYVFMVDETTLVTESPWLVIVEGHQGPTKYYLHITRRSISDVAVEIFYDDESTLVLDSQLCQ